MLVFETSHVVVEVFSYVKVFFSFNKFVCWKLSRLHPWSRLNSSSWLGAGLRRGKSWVRFRREAGQYSGSYLTCDYAFFWNRRKRRKDILRSDIGRAWLQVRSYWGRKYYHSLGYFQVITLNTKTAYCWFKYVGLKFIQPDSASTVSLLYASQSEKP